MPDVKEGYNPLNDTKLLDEINNAFIKKFKTDKFHYIYDVNTNEIVKVDEVIWNLFPDSEESYKAGLSQLKEKHGKDELQRAVRAGHVWSWDFVFTESCGFDRTEDGRQMRSIL